MNAQPALSSVIDDKKTVRRLRKTIGYLGIGLPLALFLLSLIPCFNTGIQKSISYYYYTNFRELLTGVLCAVGIFLICYRSTDNPVFWKNDNKMTNLAGFMALGVALVATNPECCSEKIYTLIPFCAEFIGRFHDFFAIVFFSILAEISICIFTIGQQVNEIKLSRLNENNIYRICGWAMIGFLAMIAISKITGLFPGSIFWLEAFALFAFGISWLIKGRFLGSGGKIGQKLYRE